MLEYSLEKRKRPLILRSLRWSDLVLNAIRVWQPLDDLVAMDQEKQHEPMVSAR